MEIMHFCINKNRFIFGLGELKAFFQLICLIYQEIGIGEHIFMCMLFFTNMVVSLYLSKSLQEGI